MTAVSSSRTVKWGSHVLPADFSSSLEAIFTFDLTSTPVRLSGADECRAASIAERRVVCEAHYRTERGIHAGWKELWKLTTALSADSKTNASSVRDSKANFREGMLKIGVNLYPFRAHLNVRERV